MSNDIKPIWHGVEGIKFSWNGQLSDPTLEYNGRRYNANEVEEKLWETPLETSSTKIDLKKFYKPERVYETLRLLA